MGNTHPIVTAIIQIGAVAAALTAIGIAVERVWGPMRKWLANALTNPLLDKLDEMKDDFDEHRQYVEYHLGPNGKTPPVHERLTIVEDSVRRIAETPD